MPEETKPAIVTVRYHQEAEGFWAEFGNWSGTAATLEELRGTAAEALGFTFGGKWRTRCYFQFGPAAGITVDPVASEEFSPDA